MCWSISQEVITLQKDSIMYNFHVACASMFFYYFHLMQEDTGEQNEEFFLVLSHIKRIINLEDRPKVPRRNYNI